MSQVDWRDITATGRTTPDDEVTGAILDGQCGSEKRHSRRDRAMIVGAEQVRSNKDT